MKRLNGFVRKIVGIEIAWKDVSPLSRMKHKSAGFLFVVFLSAWLLGCTSVPSVPAEVSPTPPSPLKTEITLTPYVDFYTPEERAAAAGTWGLEEYNAPTAGEDGSVKCVPTSANELQAKQTRFALNEEQEKARFHASTFFKTSANLWTDGSTQFGVGGVNYTRTLQISAGQIEEVTILFSPSGNSVTCVNHWKPKE
jgi:hypothetical protein